MAARTRGVVGGALTGEGCLVHRTGVGAGSERNNQ